MVIARAIAVFGLFFAVASAQSEGAADPAPDPAVEASAEDADPDQETAPGDADSSEAVVETAIPVIDREKLDARIATVEEKAPEDDPDLAFLRQAQGALKREGELDQSTADYEQIIADAPAELAKVREELAKPAPELELPTGTVDELQEALAEARRDFETANKNADDIARESSRRTERRKEIIAQEEANRAEIEEIEQSLTSTVGDDTSRVPAELVAKAARRQELQAELRATKAEVDSYNARIELIGARLDLARALRDRAEEWRDALDEAVTEALRKDAERKAEEARRRTEERLLRNEELRPEIERNEEINLEVLGLEQEVADLEKRRSRFQSELNDLTSELEAVLRIVGVGSLTAEIGSELREELETLPNQRELETDRELMRNKLGETELELYRTKSARAKGITVDGLLTRIQQVSLDGSGLDSDDVREALADLVSERQELLTRKEALLLRCRTALIQLDSTTADRADVAGELRETIQSSILWVPTAPRVSIENFGKFVSGAKWVTSPHHWRRLFTDLVDPTIPDDQDAASEQQEERTRAMVRGAVGLLLLLAWPLVARRQKRLAQRLLASRTDSFRVTVEAMVLLGLQAAPLALLTGAVAYALVDVEVPSSVLTDPVGHALRRAARHVFLFGLAFLVVANGGFGERHFRWAPDGLAHVRRHLKWGAPLVLIASFFHEVFERYHLPDWRDTTGRVCFVVLMVVIAVFYRVVLDRRRPLIGGFLERNPTSALRRFLPPLRLLASGAPLALAIAAAAGYYLSASTLETLHQEVEFNLVILLLIHALALRWLFLVRRRVAVAQARERAEARRAEGQDGDEPIDEEQVDLPSLDAQTRQLFGQGFTLAAVLVIFFPLQAQLPSFRALDRVEVFPAPFTLHSPSEELAAEVETAESTPPASETKSSTSSAAPNPMSANPSTALLAASQSSEGTTTAKAAAPGYLSLEDLLTGLFILILTTILAQNLPGLIEIAILTRLDFDSGLRYAITTITRYVIVGIGLVTGFQALGVTWSSLQWLAAALTFGLAFGLQEIFANFVSGLIVLFERPIRPGDIVDIGTVQGKVARIRMRATTVVDWDNRELIVPNKEFVTTQIINWTLSDPVTRVVIPVGLAYGSDVQTVRRLLLEIASLHESVLREPAPYAFFAGFGESTLDFELRVYIPSRSVVLDVKHDLNEAIHRRFEDEGVEIAFPQLDVHVRPIAEHPTRTPPDEDNAGEGK